MQYSQCSAHVHLMLICGLRNPTIRSRALFMTFVLTTKVKETRNVEFSEHKFGGEPDSETETNAMGK